MPGQLIRDVRATLDIDVQAAQRGLAALEKSGAAAERALREQEEAARGYQRQLEKTGTAASTMRRRLEAATRALPKITIEADSSDADKKLAALRESLGELAGKKIGIDVDGGTALEEMRRVKAELEELARSEADPIIRADVQIALRELRRVEDELDKLERDSAEVKVDVDVDHAAAAVGEIADKAGSLGSLFSEGFGVLGSVGPGQVAVAAAAIAALPTVAGVAASGIVAALGGGLATVGLTMAADADRVKHAWSETVSAIREELADAAAPLEGSAIRAADVAARTFEALKPRLARIWEGLVPDVDRFVDAVGRGIETLGPSFEHVGDSFGNLLSSLADRMPSIMSHLNDTFETFADIMDEHPTMLADLIEDASALVEAGAKVISWADELKVLFSAPLGPAGSQASSDYFFRQLFGGTPQEIAQGMEELPTTLSRMQEEAGKAVAAMTGVGQSGDSAADGVRHLTQALEEHFDPAQAALGAEIRLKQALEEAGRAAKTKGLSDLERLQAVQNLTSAISEAAKAESERTGKTDQAGRSFAEQLPKLVAWAGKNDAAKAAVGGLGESLGITIKRTDEGAVAVDKFGRAVIQLPNGKTVKVDADTAKALAAIQDAQRKVDGMKDKTITVRVRVEQDGSVRLPGGLKASPNARGSISQDGVRLMAAGGVLQPMITERAVYSPRNNAIFGEAGKEAFIPYASAHRERASDILAKVADDFGYLLINKTASKALSGVAESVQLSADQYQIHMGAVIDELDSTLGQTGSLTAAIGAVGATGEQLVDGWTSGSAAIGDSVSDMGQLVSVSVSGMADTMSGSIDGLTGAVEQLGDAVSASISKTTGTASTKKKGGGAFASASISSSTGTVSRKGGVGASLKEETGVIDLVPAKTVLRPDQYGVHVGGGGVAYNTAASSASAGSMLAAATLKSVPAGGGLATTSAGAGGGAGGGVSIGAFYASPDQSPYEIAQDLDWIARRGG
ncbi:hypothetical protein MF672_010895 [Actinomadura sp. ATCC 31491]|uniref:Phage tail tape measure protein n=1 Tax=Actinomadura luzonensis TaxID=2805427 RepID=A0ABT0FPN8_9ACTN|nr:hypothetical protein [Actinomadura luzonensis]MCK2214294.1 hypothetical protein [Actinomadura luzonensis]